MPKKDGAHRSKSPDSHEESESSHSESEANDAESGEESSNEATPASWPMNPSVNIKVTTEIRHAKSLKIRANSGNNHNSGQIKLLSQHELLGSRNQRSPEAHENNSSIQMGMQSQCTRTHISKGVLPNKRRK